MSSALLLPFEPVDEEIPPEAPPLRDPFEGLRSGQTLVGDIVARAYRVVWSRYFLLYRWDVAQLAWGLYSYRIVGDLLAAEGMNRQILGYKSWAAEQRAPCQPLHPYRALGRPELERTSNHRRLEESLNYVVADWGVTYEIAVKGDRYGFEATLTRDGDVVHRASERQKYAALSRLVASNARVWRDAAEVYCAARGWRSPVIEVSDAGRLAHARQHRETMAEARRFTDLVELARRVRLRAWGHLRTQSRLVASRLDEHVALHGELQTLRDLRAATEGLSGVDVDVDRDAGGSVYYLTVGRLTWSNWRTPSAVDALEQLRTVIRGHATRTAADAEERYQQSASAIYSTVHGLPLVRPPTWHTMTRCEESIDQLLGETGWTIQ